MRTFSAVRTRLRAGTHGGQADGRDDPTNGDRRGYGSRQATAVDTAAPMDPLLAEQAADNGDEPAPEFDAWLDEKQIWHGDRPGERFGDPEVIL